VRRHTDGADAAVRRRRTLQMLNYMLLTVVVNGKLTTLLSFFIFIFNGHNCVATAMAGNAQGHSQDFTLVATEAERRSIFFSKKLTIFF